MNIIDALEKQVSFNLSDQELANYILKHKEKVLDMSVQQLASNTYSSTSAIVRLCRKIGLKGYKDFKIKFSAELQRKYDSISNVDPNFPFTDDDSYIEISTKLFELMQESLLETHLLFSSELIEQAVKKILHSSRIGIFSEGDSYLRSLGFQNRLMKININVLLTPLPGENNQLAATFTKDDCAIVVSYSGESKALLEAVQTLKRNHTTIIIVTANPTSRMAKLSNIILSLPKKESQSVKFSPLASQVSIEYVLDVLYACLFVADYDQNQKIRTKTEMTFIKDKY